MNTYGPPANPPAQPLAPEEENRVAALETDNRRLCARVVSLEEANRDLEAFSLCVLHDLRAPLRHIGGFADLLRNRCATLDDTARRYAGLVVDASRRASRLVEDLLAFARLGSADLRRTDIDTNALVAEVRAEVEAEAAADGRTLSWRVADLPPIRADATLLRVVWRNLLGNAVKYTRQRATARVEVSYRSDGDAPVFSVADNGAGFDMRHVEKLFNLFQRLHGSDEFEGIGIGLAIVRRIVARHGGRIWAEGAVGRGATFSFTLPPERS